MAKPDEIEDADNLDEEDNSDEDTEDEEDEDESDEDEDSEDSSDDDDEDDDSDEDDEDEEDEDDSDDSDDSEDDSKPLSRKERKQLEALQKRAKRGKDNRSAAARRKSEKGAFSKTRKADEERIARIEKQQKQFALSEKKRTFGHKTGLAPDEVDTLYRITGRLKRKDLKDPVVKGALDGHRQAKRVRGNVPTTNGRPFRPNSKEMKNASPAERRSAFLDRRRGILAEKKG